MSTTVSQIIDDTSPQIIYACAYNTSLPDTPSTSSVTSDPFSSTTTDSSTGWQVIQSSVAQGGTYHITAGRWCTAQISFVGSSVQLFGATSFQNGIYGCSIDAEEPVWFNAWSSSSTIAINLLCGVSGLSSGSHILELTNGPLTDWQASLDYVSLTAPSNSSSPGKITSDNPSFPLSSTAYAQPLSSYVAWHRYKSFSIFLAVLAIIGGVALIVIHCWCDVPCCACLGSSRWKGWKDKIAKQVATEKDKLSKSVKSKPNSKGKGSGKKAGSPTSKKGSSDSGSDGKEDSQDNSSVSHESSSDTEKHLKSLSHSRKYRKYKRRC